jgi:hypothetical protein
MIFSWYCVQEVAMTPKYPDIVVPLTGHDGNAYAILGRVLQAMRRAEIPEDARQAFQREATSGDYDHLLQTIMRWVDVS